MSSADKEKEARASKAAAEREKAAGIKKAYLKQARGVQKFLEREQKIDSLEKELAELKAARVENLKKYPFLGNIVGLLERVSGKPKKPKAATREEQEEGAIEEAAARGESARKKRKLETEPAKGN